MFRTHSKKHCARTETVFHHPHCPTILVSSPSSERSHLSETGFLQENLRGVLKSPTDAKAHQRTKKLREAKCRAKASFKSLKMYFFNAGGIRTE